MIDLILNEQFIRYLFIILAILTPAGVGIVLTIFKPTKLSPLTRLWLIIIGAVIAIIIIIVSVAKKKKKQK